MKGGGCIAVWRVSVRLCIAGLLVKSGNSLTDPEQQPAGDGGGGGGGGGGGRLGLEIALGRTEIAPGARWWQPPVQPCVRLLKVMNESRDEDRAACLHAVASFCVPSQLWLRAADVKIGDGSKTDWHGRRGARPSHTTCDDISHHVS